MAFATLGEDTQKCTKMTVICSEVTWSIFRWNMSQWHWARIQGTANYGPLFLKDRGEPAYDVNIRRFISHHRYKPPKQYYDIALVELVEEVSFRWHVHPACLWTKFENPSHGTVTGWGVIETGKQFNNYSFIKSAKLLVLVNICPNQSLDFLLSKSFEEIYVLLHKLIKQTIAWISWLILPRLLVVFFPMTMIYSS